MTHHIPFGRCNTWYLKDVTRRHLHPQCCLMTRTRHSTLQYLLQCSMLIIISDGISPCHAKKLSKSKGIFSTGLPPSLTPPISPFVTPLYVNAESGCPSYDIHVSTAPIFAFTCFTLVAHTTHIYIVGLHLSLKRSYQTHPLIGPDNVLVLWSPRSKGDCDSTNCSSVYGTDVIWVFAPPKSTTPNTDCESCGYFESSYNKYGKITNDLCPLNQF